MFQRISKATAKKRFANNEAIYLCPCKCHPYRPFSFACLILSHDEWIAHAALHDDVDDKEGLAWQLMYNSWEYYNASYETGYYAHYYIETDCVACAS
jgi:hypothetical protein